MTGVIPAPEAVIEMSLSRCSIGCTSKRCRCFKCELVGTDMCYCINCDNVAIGTSCYENMHI